uniref:NADH dehydrogenase subunit 4L n=1 Tax=Leocrates chinensis TaxID=378359 RepID=UPI0021D52535|nr:NADH dehydrogenase subunit 4L [Leocrates chinensis]UXC96464.1 NADH dehydrogenase subunit 4L [Leocrates chinensis]
MILATISAITTMALQRHHILMCLLALEGMILMLLAFIISVSSMELFLSLVILTMGACEASLGLACLVLMTRSFGNDMIASLTSSKC